MFFADFLTDDRLHTHVVKIIKISQKRQKKTFLSERKNLYKIAKQKFENSWEVITKQLKRLTNYQTN